MTSNRKSTTGDTGIVVPITIDADFERSAREGVRKLAARNEAAAKQRSAKRRAENAAEVLVNGDGVCGRG